jgi:hypothetical protein
VVALGRSVCRGFRLYTWEFTYPLDPPCHRSRRSSANGSVYYHPMEHTFLSSSPLPALFPYRLGQFSAVPTICICQATGLQSRCAFLNRYCFSLCAYRWRYIIATNTRETCFLCKLLPAHCSGSGWSSLTFLFLLYLA